MTARELSYLLLFTTWATAVGVACRHREHRPVAALFALVLVGNLARAALAPLVSADPPNTPYFIAQALFVGESFSLAATALVVLTSRQWWGGVPFYIVCIANLIVYADAITAERLARFYLAVELATLAVCVGLLARAGAGWWRRRERPGLHHDVLAMIVAVELVSVAFGPWRYGIWARWDLAQWAQVALYGVLTLVQGGAWALERRQ